MRCEFRLEIVIERVARFLVPTKPVWSQGTRIGHSSIQVEAAVCIDRESRLVSATTGLPVIDINNRPIEIRDINNVQIGADGTVRQRDIVLGQLQVIDVPARTRLSKAGHGQFRATADALANRRTAGGQVRQGMLEGSAVDPVGAMLAITDAGRAAEANLAMIQAHDRLMDRAINVLGRVA